MISGVCTGLAKYLDIDPVLVRVGFVLGAFANGIGILAYIILWVLVPQRPYAHDLYPDSDVVTDMEPPKPRSAMLSPAMIFGGILIAVGILSLIDNLFPSIHIGHLWPMILIALGIGLIVRNVRKSEERVFEMPGNNPTEPEEPRSSESHP